MLSALFLPEIMVEWINQILDSKTGTGKHFFHKMLVAICKNPQHSFLHEFAKGTSRCLAREAGDIA